MLSPARYHQNYSVMPALKYTVTPQGFMLEDTSRSGCLFGGLAFFLAWNSVVWIAIAIVLIVGSIAFPFILIPMSIFGFIALVITLLEIRKQKKFTQANIFVSDLPLYLGETKQITFRQIASKRTQIDRVQAILKCREEVRYGVGTDVQTEQHEIWSGQFADEQIRPPSNQLQLYWNLQIPKQQPASFSTANNSIEWLIEVTVHSKRSKNTASFLLAVMPEIV